ncbi:hypothetical protein VitviT2T_022632 [Vitis vinifera]|uniref:Aquaporin NIP2-1 n=1 Tax=Vitis vinifera TaxID=29760 RepID=A0ABY9DAD4_VITVI|nr:hypothetical protein VitviT2T_022632 [Vitis vinifera]
MATTDPNLSNSTSINELTTALHHPDSQNSNPCFLWRLFLEHYPPGFLRKVVAEVIATYLLVFVTCGSAALSASDEQRVSKLGASVAGGLIVTAMIYAVGHISGAHMNPAVTLAFAAVRHFPWKQVPLYAAAQLTGAIGAAFTLRELLYPIKHLGTTTPSGTEIQALVMEIVVTFSMMFITSAVATDTKAVNTRLFKIFPPFPFSLTYICFSILAFIDRRASRHSSWFSSMHNFHLGRTSIRWLYEPSKDSRASDCQR